ncbi:hypothetical protein BKA65DRAFT_114817 [Rhexocercosporidium sp. MPI-PUGE-AT-0058]|nr:hypothetical protein BKA65DRAFT_114817 [Rhexocercosporidium sp. MPI-PUGE-AT-0058]
MGDLSASLPCLLLSLLIDLVSTVLLLASSRVIPLPPVFRLPFSDLALAPLMSEKVDRTGISTPHTFRIYYLFPAPASAEHVPASLSFSADLASHRRRSSSDQPRSVPASSCINDREGVEHNFSQHHDLRGKG